MKHAIVTNLPQNPKEIYDYALSKSFQMFVDEKGTEKHPGHMKRERSDLSYEQAFEIIQNNKPHWVVSFRNQSFITLDGEDYWEFGGCNIKDSDYGEVFIWIKVNPLEAQKIFTIFGVEVKEY